MADRIHRFSRSERAAHWLLAAAFFTMLLTGGMVPHQAGWHSVALDAHVGAAIVLAAGLTLLAAQALSVRQTARDLAVIDADDRAWLSPTRVLKGTPLPPVGRSTADER